jgi:hypothetical protein
VAYWGKDVDPLPGITTGGPINLLVGESNSTTFAGSYIDTGRYYAGSLTIKQQSIYGSPTG